MDELLKIIPAVVAAVLAGIGAIAKTLYERRDGRLTAHRQLELAVKRTEFVSGWVEACRSVAGDDEDFVALAARRARVELEEAYAEAQAALANSRSVLAGSGSKTLGQQLASVMLLGRRRRRTSYVVVVAFYVVVLGLVSASLSSDPRIVDGEPNEDYMAWWQYGLVALVSTVVLRVLAGVVIAWLEGRGAPAARPATTTPNVPAPEAVAAFADPPAPVGRTGG
jgi:hypothetical protein